MTSTRLPGKVLKTVLGKPLLEYQIERLRRVVNADDIVLATTTNHADQPIIDLCDRLAIQYHRGSEEDVLARYYHAAVACSADVVVRVTSDCPVIDHEVVDKVIRFYRDRPDYDYVSNNLVRTYPRGMDTEVFSFSALVDAFTEGVEKFEREHVTPFIYLRPQRYQLGNVAFDGDESRHRWTVDTPEDFELIRRIIESLYPEKNDFTLEDMLELFKIHAEWADINSHIQQKTLGQ